MHINSMCAAAEMMPMCFSDESVNCSLPPSERLVSSTLERERGGERVILEQR